MRWPTATEPRLHDRREREFFAWLPYNSHGTAYWLEFITVEEFYIPDSHGGGSWMSVGDVVSARSPWSF